MISSCGVALCYLALVSSVISAPVESGFSGVQYSNAQSLTPQQTQPSYITAPQPVQPQTPAYQPQSPSFGPPTQVVSQLLLPTNVDRQIQKAAQQIAGPQYVQQIQILQQQELANQAVAAAQRRAMRQRMLAQQAQQQHGGLSGLGGQFGAASSDVYSSQALAQAQTPQQYLQYQPQTARPVARPAPQVYSRPQPQGKDEDLEEYDTPASYKFGFDVTDDQNTNYQNRQEQRDGNKISGSYSVVDSDGFIRTVTYTADPKEGFKAEVVRKPTDIVVKIPTPTPAPKEQYVQNYSAPRGQESKGNVIYQYQ
uniref:Cuticular protein CPR12611 n=1 Tax=Trypoxylus dichotomus TaxID=273928 RepID=A0A8F2WF19_TRYDI|nr:cuticular protein CPR12611 [Trypoxylus dichotomus]